MSKDPHPTPPGYRSEPLTHKQKYHYRLKQGPGHTSAMLTALHTGIGSVWKRSELHPTWADLMHRRRTRKYLILPNTCLEPEATSRLNIDCSVARYLLDSQPQPSPPLSPSSRLILLFFFPFLPLHLPYIPLLKCLTSPTSFPLTSFLPPSPRLLPGPLPKTPPSHTIPNQIIPSLRLPIPPPCSSSRVSPQKAPPTGSNCACPPISFLISPRPP